MPRTIPETLPSYTFKSCTRKLNIGVPVPGPICLLGSNYDFVWLWFMWLKFSELGPRLLDLKKSGGLRNCIDRSDHEMASYPCKYGYIVWQGYVMVLFHPDRSEHTQSYPVGYFSRPECLLVSSQHQIGQQWFYPEPSKAHLCSPSCFLPLIPDYSSPFCINCLAKMAWEFTPGCSTT